MSFTGGSAPERLAPCPPLPPFKRSLSFASNARGEKLTLTQEQLANDTDLHQRGISNVETGKRNPSYASLRRLAAGLGLSASELLSRAEQIEASSGRAPKAKAASRR